MNNNFLFFAAFLCGYAEIHYRFRFFFSLLKHSEPELIFDAPYRIESGNPVPLFLIVNDSIIYPISSEKVFVNCVHESGKEENFSFDFKKKFSTDYSDSIFRLNLNLAGKWKITPNLIFSQGGNKKQMTVDNYKSTSKKPLEIYVSESKFPKYENQFSGDLHHHTRFTFDQVEFGAGLQITKQCVESIGMDFLCLTDHSYDLDDEENNYLKNDPELKKWNRFLTEVDTVNSEKNESLFIPGFELSTGNSKGKNVHLLMYGQREFITGSGDSAEKWFQTKPETFIGKAISIKQKNTVTYAAHPFEPVDFLQSKLLGRGNYSHEEIFEHQLPLQLLNGKIDSVFLESKNIWISALLKGLKIPIGAGNDAHGNFNRYRQVQIPFFTMKELPDQILGKFRTVVQCEFNTENLILSALRNGNSYLTNGIAVQLKNDREEIILFSSEKKQKEISTSSLMIKTTSEFGELKTVKIFLGALKSESEIEIQLSGFEKSVNLSEFLTDVQDYKHIRFEVFGGKETVLFSNPVYIS